MNAKQIAFRAAVLGVLGFVALQLTDQGFEKTYDKDEVWEANKEMFKDIGFKGSWSTKHECGEEYNFCSLVLTSPEEVLTFDTQGKRFFIWDSLNTATLEVSVGIFNDEKYGFSKWFKLEHYLKKSHRTKVHEVQIRDKTIGFAYGNYREVFIYRVDPNWGNKHPELVTMVRRYEEGVLEDK